MRIKKLQLSRETIRELSNGELSRLAAAGPKPTTPQNPCVYSEGGTCRVTFCDPCTVGCNTNGDITC